MACQSRRSTLFRIAEHLQVVETIDGEELDRLLDENSAIVGPLTPTVTRDGTGAVRIAAAEGLDWEANGSNAAPPSDDAPPVAAS